MSASVPDPQALLAQTRWVRSLVRGIGVDESSADDVVQSTWLAALAAPPRERDEGPRLRAWIARVAGNFARKTLGRDEARAARERHGARPEELPSTAEIVEREEARREIVSALLELSEPYRTTLLLRFYEELEPAAIAKLQNVPDSTVRNRLKRGLALLRERLERSHGAEWQRRCRMVLPFVPSLMQPMLPTQVQPTMPARVQPTGPVQAQPTGPQLAQRTVPPMTPRTVPPSGSPLAPLPRAVWKAVAIGKAVLGGVLVANQLKIAVIVVLIALTALVGWKVREIEPAQLLVAEQGKGPASKLAAPLSEERAEQPVRLSEPGASGQREALTVASPNAAPADTIPVSAEGFATVEGRLIDKNGQPLEPEGQQVTFLRRMQPALDDNAQNDEVLDRIVLSAFLKQISKQSGAANDGRAADPDAQFAALDQLDQLDQTERYVELSAPKYETDANEDHKGDAPPATGTLNTRLFACQSLLPRYDVPTVHLDRLGTTGEVPRVTIANATGDVRECEVDEHGSFAFTDVPTGKWNVIATATGHATKIVQVEIRAGERRKHVELTLDPASSLHVKLLTPDGRDLAQVIAADPELAAHFPAIVFASRKEPARQTDDCGPATNARTECSRWKAHSECKGDGVGEATGVLTLTEPLPLYVGVSVRGVVLAQKFVTSGTQDVEFKIALDAVRGCLGKIEFTLVDRGTHAALAEVSVSLEGCDDAVTSDSQGAVRFERVPPGRHKLTIAAADHELFTKMLDVAPGSHRALGSIELERRFSVHGRVIDERGNGVGARLLLCFAEGGDERGEPAAIDNVSTDEQGAFRFEAVGRRRYLLLADPTDWSFRPEIVDLRGGSSEELVIRASKATEVRVGFPFEAPPHSRLELETSDGIHFGSRTLEGWHPITLSLAEGSYRAQLIDPDSGAVLASRSIAVHDGKATVSDAGNH